MKSLIYFLPIIFTSIIGAQTHFTIPQNVWRVSLKTDHSSGKWKGNNLSDGQKYRYQVDTLNFEVSQFLKDPQFKVRQSLNMDSQIKLLCFLKFHM